MKSPEKVDEQREMYRQGINALFKEVGDLLDDSITTSITQGSDIHAYYRPPDFPKDREVHVQGYLGFSSKDTACVAIYDSPVGQTDIPYDAKNLKEILVKNFPQLRHNSEST